MINKPMRTACLYFIVTGLGIQEGLTADSGDDCPLIHGVGEPLAKLNECGRLSYGLYANEGQSNAVHRLPDFSFAGYRGGGVALPTADVKITLRPGSGDDRARIQNAIDKVSALPVDADGLRGAVRLGAGTYEVSDTLYIRTSGVVVRGEGQGEDGTVLVFTKQEKADLLVVKGSGDAFPKIPESVRIQSPYVPVGSSQFDIESVAGFAVGQVIGILRTPNQHWIDTLNMAQWGWTTDQYHIHQERSIAAIDGNTISIDAPIVDTIEDQFGGGEVFRVDLSGRVREVGVEDLRLVSEYDGDEDEQHGWNAIRLDRAQDSWVRRVTVKNFGYAAVKIDNSSYNTVEEVAMLDPVSIVTGGRRYSFVVTGGTGNLFQRCYSAHARHDFAIQAKLTGPNVWLDSYAHRSYTDQGPHHRWSAGSLLDNIRGNYLHVENRRDSGTGHGWAAAQTLFWNSVATGFRVFAPLGAMNWSIGGVGLQQTKGMWSSEEPLGWWESHGKPVDTRSLYLQQLRDRLGDEAVTNITTAAQRDGRTWTQLAAWAGSGSLSDFENGDDSNWPNQLSLSFRHYYEDATDTSPLRNALGSPRRIWTLQAAKGDYSFRSTLGAVADEMSVWKTNDMFHTLAVDGDSLTVFHCVSDDGIRFTPVSEEAIFNATGKIIFDDGAPRYFLQLANARASLNGNDEVVAILLDAVPNPEDTSRNLEVLIFPVDNYDGSLMALSSQLERSDACEQLNQLSIHE